MITHAKWVINSWKIACSDLNFTALRSNPNVGFMLLHGRSEQTCMCPVSQISSKLRWTQWSIFNPHTTMKINSHFYLHWGPMDPQNLSIWHKLLGQSLKTSWGPLGSLRVKVNHLHPPVLLVSWPHLLHISDRFAYSQVNDDFNRITTLGATHGFYKMFLVRFPIKTLFLHM